MGRLTSKLCVGVVIVRTENLHVIIIIDGEYKLFIIHT